MWLLIDVAAIRRHPARDELEASVVMPTALVLHPELRKAAERILLTARSGERSPDWAVVVEHRLSAAELEDYFQGLASRCAPRRVEGVQRAVRCGWSRRLLVAAVGSGLVVYTPNTHAAVATALVGSGGLEVPTAALEAEVEAPAQTLRGRRMPEVPTTIQRGRGELRLEPEGAVLLLEGVSGSPGQATEDAETLNGLVDELDLPGPDLLRRALRRALHFDVSGTTVRLEKRLGTTQLRLFLLLVDMLSRSVSPSLEAVGESRGPG
jgi:hypothetical protein